jgi:hypothetical protein
LKRSLVILAAGAMLAAGPVFAHHSAAMFDQSKLVVLKGTVRSFSYVNPHSWISVQGSPAGKGAPVRWDVEAVAPGALARLGIQGDTLKPGEKVTVAIRPLRDGRNAGSLVFVTGADGKSYGAKPSDLGLNPDGSPLPGGAAAG